MSEYAVVSVASVAIERPARYAKQLASHMGHKVPFVKVGENYTAKFGETLSELEPGETVLVMRVSGATSEDLAGAQFALEKHLRKFASDQELVIEWEIVG